MGKLQIKYNFLHIFFFITYCAVYGYVTLFLQSKGMSNSLVGIVTGVGAISTIVLSPFISSLLSKIKGLTIKKLLTVLYTIMIASFLIVTFIPLPDIAIMILYMSIIAFLVSGVPILSTICMDYLKAGQYLNFGLSRGMGSVAYASCAVVLGRLIESLGTNVLAITFTVFGLLFLATLYSMPNIQIERGEVQKEGSVFSVIKKYKVYFCLLVGFAIAFAATSSLNVYLVNIVTNLGGSTSLYGIAVFLMGTSEMPVMSITHSLLKRVSAETLFGVAAICYIARNFLICLAPNIVILLIGMLFQGVSYGLFFAVVTYYVADHLKQEDQVMGQTLIAMMTTGFGSTVGNLLGGFLQDNFGLNSMLLFVEMLTAIGVVIVLFTLLKTRNPNKSNYKFLVHKDN